MKQEFKGIQSMKQTKDNDDFFPSSDVPNEKQIKLYLECIMKDPRSTVTYAVDLHTNQAEAITISS